MSEYAPTDPVRATLSPATDPASPAEPASPTHTAEVVRDKMDVMGLRTQVVRFVATGTLSAVVDYGLYTALFVLGLTLSAAKSISFVAGTTTAYLINRRWTFRAAPSRARFAAVAVLYAITFAVQVGLNATIYHTLPAETWRRLFAYLVAQATATTINFIVARAVIFRVRSSGAAS